jgi:hypothetical protein
MTPKEKAKELVGKCKIEIYNEVPALQSNMFHLCILKSAKKCVLVAIDEILQHIEVSYVNEDIIKGAKLYWEQVKQEIENYE